MTRYLLGLAVLITACSTPEQVEESSYAPMKYDIYFGDRLAGFQESWQEDDGTYRFIYEFNDRGRGPHYEERIKLNSKGIIEFQEILGHNYLKDTVAEVFQAVENEASWKSNTEEGSSVYSGEAYYVSVDGSMGSAELMIQQLLREEDRELNLLPGGTIRVTDITHHNFGDSLDLNLVQASGMAFTPFYAWIDNDHRLFAQVSSWSSTIREGYEALTEDLLEIQTEKEMSYLESLATDLVEVPEGRTIIQNVTLFDSKTGESSSGINVVIEGNEIVSVTSEEVDTSAPAVVIDGTGKFLMPGLFDNHTHIAGQQGILHVAAGVTSVRDMANALTLPLLREDFATKRLIGPRINIMSGFVDQAGPYAGPTGKIVSSLEEGLEGIDYYAEQGYEQIKLYSSIDPEWVKPLAERAHEHGMRLSGHIPAYMIASQAVESGYDEIQHINMLALNFLPDTIDTRTPLRFSMIAEHTHALDLESGEFTEFMDLLKEKGTVVDPTVSIFEGMLTTKAGDPDPSFSTIIDRLPLQVQRGFYSGGLPIPEGKQEQFQESYAKLLDIVKALHDNGIPIIPGTDALPGFGLHRELENYVRAGISPADVLRSATSVSADISNVSSTLGSIEEGKVADMILIDGNPLENISDIRRVELTIMDGRLYRAAELYEAVGVKHFQ